ncbi:hypothetical protein ACJX0J_017630, partial [Zea mays]
MINWDGAKLVAMEDEMILTNHNRPQQQKVTTHRITLLNTNINKIMLINYIDYGGMLYVCDLLSSTFYLIKTFSRIFYLSIILNKGLFTLNQIINYCLNDILKQGNIHKTSGVSKADRLQFCQCEGILARHHSRRKILVVVANAFKNPVGSTQLIEVPVIALKEIYLKKILLHLYRIHL